MRLGGPPLTSAMRALAHADALMAECPGLTPTHFARLAGIAHNLLFTARSTNSIEVESEARILAVTRRHVVLCPPPQMPTRIVHDHVRSLLDETGVYRNTIARAADVNYQTVYNVLAPKWPHVRWRIYAALMALTPDDLVANNYWVDRRPTMTRLRALQANRHSLQHLGAAHGMNMFSLVNADPESPMHAPVTRRVKAIYDAIGDEPGSSARSATIARGLGYMPPIYYDEDMNLIDVDEDVDNGQSEARGDLCALALTLEGRSLDEIVARLGISRTRVTRVRSRYGVRMDRSLDGGYEASEVIPGAVAAIRAATRGLHYRSSLDVLDGADVDYVALRATLLRKAKTDSVAA